MWSLMVMLAAQGPAEVVAPVPPAPAPEPAATAPAVIEDKPRLLVMVPSGDSVPAEVRRAIAATLTIELARTGNFAALSSAELSQLAELEADKAEAGLSLFDVDTASSVRRTSFEVKDRADIPARARLAAGVLAGPGAAAVLLGVP